MKNILTGLLAFLIVTSCAKKPEFIGIDNVSILGLKDSLMLVTMNYIIYNPNNIKTQLKQSGMLIYCQDDMVGKGFLDREISLTANDTLKVPVRFEVGLDKLSKYYPEMLQSDSTAFDIRGESSVRFLLNSFDIDIADRIHLNTSEIIKEEIRKNLKDTEHFKIKKISIKSLPSLNRTRFSMEILSKNNLPFDYELSNLELKFYLDTDESSLAKWNLEQPLQQKAWQSNSIPVDVTLNNFSILKQAEVQWLTKGMAEFTVIGEAQILIKGYSFAVPISDKITADLKTLSGF